MEHWCPVCLCCSANLCMFAACARWHINCPLCVSGWHTGVSPGEGGNKCSWCSMSGGSGCQQIKQFVLRAGFCFCLPLCHTVSVFIPPFSSLYFFVLSSLPWPITRAASAALTSVLRPSLLLSLVCTLMTLAFADEASPSVLGLYTCARVHVSVSTCGRCVRSTALWDQSVLMKLHSQGLCRPFLITSRDKCTAVKSRRGGRGGGEEERQTSKTQLWFYFLLLTSILDDMILNWFNSSVRYIIRAGL